MSENWKIQVSPKTPSGTLINIRGETPEEVQALLSGVHELVVLITGLEQAFGAVGALSPLSTGGSTANQEGQTSSDKAFPSKPPVVLSPSGSPTCIHGPRTFKTGVKNGRTWSSWMCPTPKGTPDQCQPVWA